MATVILRSIFFAYFLIYVFGGEIELEVQSAGVLKMLRDMMNQSAAESLNLIANATSIRENITDTFSCENRTYGYYADVDNDCQLFHVCVPSQSPSGRNTTYRYSFICPAETIFNQEVLVCTRPIDSIPCDEAPNFYDLNMEIGKMVDPEINKENQNKETEMVAVKNKKQTIRRKQNIIMEALMKDGDEQMKELEELYEGEKIIELPEEKERVEVTYQPIAPETIITNAMETQAIMNQENESKPLEMNSETFEYQMPAESGNERLGSERSIKRTGRKMWRGSLKFRSDV
ncbi:peritrophin type-A domain protein 3 [Danaus plexippus plexippus]|uniref:Peritrophin type-A domain protein 3 n=1 Tax=Danaus plexippus plexippus TaxID=278856 RepID=A0A212EPM8_DANPL|nr:peritrophin type-A domain protein 3 [Danaus plexippus plexippus]